MKALDRLTLGEARKAIDARVLLPSDYARWLLKHVQASEPELHAWAALDEARVLAAAEAAERVHPTAQGALHALPIGVKDIIDTRDLPTAWGVPVQADRRPAQDAACVQRIVEAGGYVFGKTVTTECAFMQPSATRNPWNTAHTPGGSSSGSAAAVAARHVPAALGTQTNGSIIRPAAYCGVVGFKPSAGRVDRRGVMVFSETLDVVGSFARNVADAARLASVIARPGCIAPRVAVRERPPRIALLERYPWLAPDVESAAALDAVVSGLRRAGAEVAAVAWPDAFDEAPAVHRTIMLHEGARNLAGLPRAQRSATLDAALDEGAAIGAGDYRRALASRAVMGAALVDWLGSFDAALSLSAPSPAPASLDTTGDPRFCTLWSLTGAPAVSLPMGLAANRLPLGLQLASTPGDDDALLSGAAWVETRLEFRGLP